jgi:hypothetical protein
MTDTTRTLIRSLVMDRRDFCSKLALAAAGTFVANALPFSPALAAAEVTTPEASFGTGSVDDIFGSYPSYAEPIGYGRPQLHAMTQSVAEFPYWV